MPEKLDRCVDKVKGEKGVDSAYAICTDAMKEVVNAMSIVGVKEFTSPMNEGGVGSGIKGHLADVGQAVADYAPDIVSHGVDILSGMGMTEGGVGSGRKPFKARHHDEPPPFVPTAPRTPKAKPAMPYKPNKTPMTETCTPCEMKARLNNQIIEAMISEGGVGSGRKKTGRGAEDPKRLYGKAGTPDPNPVDNPKWYSEDPDPTGSIWPDVHPKKKPKA